MLGIFVSMVVLLGVSAKNVKQLGIIQMIIRLFQTCTPGMLILTQLIVLIVLFANNNDIIYYTVLISIYERYTQCILYYTN